MRLWCQSSGRIRDGDPGGVGDIYIGSVKFLQRGRDMLREHGSTVSLKGQVVVVISIRKKKALQLVWASSFPFLEQAGPPGI